MKTVGTITFHDTRNYGALLQCYALQQVLIRIGYQAEVIDYRNFNHYLGKVPLLKAAKHRCWAWTVDHVLGRKRAIRTKKFIQENICLTCGRISFDTKTRLAQIDHMPLSLTRKESSLLEYFLLHPDQVISPEELIEHIWDGSVNSFSNSIRVHISSLRKKLRAALGYDPIQNKIGEGYLLNADCCND